jgi:hypothetical protein
MLAEKLVQLYKLELEKMENWNEQVRFLSRILSPNIFRADEDRSMLEKAGITVGYVQSQGMQDAGDPRSVNDEMGAAPSFFDGERELVGKELEDVFAPIFSVFIEKVKPTLFPETLERVPSLLA